MNSGTMSMTATTTTVTTKWVKVGMKPGEVFVIRNAPLAKVICKYFLISCDEQ